MMYTTEVGLNVNPTIVIRYYYVAVHGPSEDSSVQIKTEGYDTSRPKEGSYLYVYVTLSHLRSKLQAVVHN